ncbi:MAG: ATP-binding protein [Planctomycetota bacterium]|jgi:predicted AAA+ superfamily ATPase
MIDRKVADKVLEYSRQYPVITITGPRQSGKTTLCKMLFPEKDYVSMEDLDNRNQAMNDPRGFLARFPDGAIVDEIQRTPDLLSYIQTIVDDANKEGMYILTGSRQFEMMESISQSLAGRTALVKLLPFSFDEIYKDNKPDSVDEVLYRGFYPRIFDKNLNPSEALSFYVNTYIERDVRSIININDLTVFGNFLKLCAGRSGQLVNFNNLGDECGVSHNTIKSWISILEASYIIKLIRPYYKNINKRMVKASKLFFLDSGLQCYLLGALDPSHLSQHPLRGSIFETFVVSEIIKQYFHTGTPESLYFYRDYQGHEVDLVMEKALALSAVEIKSSATFNDSFTKGVRYFNKLVSGESDDYVVYAGAESFLNNDVSVVSWNHISSIKIR